MGTQKTNLGGNTNYVSSNIEGNDTLEIAGRKVRKVSPQEMQRKMMEETIERGASTILDPTPPSLSTDEKAILQEQVENMMPEYLQDNISNQNKQPVGNSTKEPSSDENKQAIDLLVDEIKNAKQRGDEDAVKKYELLLAKLINKPSVVKSNTKKRQHAVLDKLKQKMGIQKIEPFKVEWADMVWLFYPSNALVDAWVAQVMEAHNFAAVKVCSMLVGLDDVPLYEVLGIETSSTYTIETGEKVEIPLFPKNCDVCGEQVDLKDTKCSKCGASLDPFDMPIELRVTCASAFHEWLVKNFGPYENLVDLLALVQDHMKDRISDREELYPFLKTPPKPLQTTRT